MRHRVKKTRVGHNRPLSNSILRNLSTSIIIYEKVKTTKLRATLVKSILEKLITSAKQNEPHNAMKLLNAYLLDPKASEKLMKVFLPKYKDRTSGYVRLTGLGFRAGDAATMVQVELI